MAMKSGGRLTRVDVHASMLLIIALSKQSVYLIVYISDAFYRV